jgi:GNAT superfamily N-acetyltransferase
MRIRRMTEADAPRVADLTTQLGYPSDEDAARRRIADVRSRDAGELLVAVDDADRPIGWIQVARVHLLAEDAVASIDGLVVDDGTRSAGIGAALVEAAEAWARDAGADAMVVRSRSTREGAHRFYERIGYSEIKRSHVFRKPIV